MNIQDLIDEVHAEHLERLTRCDTMPMEPKKVVRKVPQTHLIAQAAYRALERRLGSAE